jgi:hypothetical protein
VGGRNSVRGGVERGWGSHRHHGCRHGGCGPGRHGHGWCGSREMCGHCSGHRWGTGVVVVVAGCSAVKEVG